MSFLAIQTQGVGGTSGGIQTIFTHNNASTGTPGSDPGDPPFNAVLNQFVPFDTVIKNVSIKASGAPGPIGRDQNFRIKSNTDSNVSPIMTYTDPGVDVSTLVNGTLPGLLTSSDAAIQSTRCYVTGWPNQNNNNLATAYLAYEYEVSPHTKVCWYICGIAVGTASTFSGSDTYAHIVAQGFSSGNTVLRPNQGYFPIGGTVQYCALVWNSLTAGTSVEVALQKGSSLGSSSDTAILFNASATSPTANLQAVVDNTTQVAITAGDLLNWRIKRTAGAGTTGGFCAIFGFTAS